MNLNLPKNSRFTRTPLYQDSSGNPQLSLWVPPSRSGVRSETLYVLNEADVDRPDRIAAIVYGSQNTGLWWYILHYNNIHDMWSLKAGDKLIVPAIQAIPPMILRSTALPEATVARVPRVHRYVPPRFTVVAGIEDDLEDEDTDTTVSTDVELSTPFGFPMPKCDTGIAHFEVEVSTLESFAELIFASSTVTSPSDWQFFNPYTGSGSYESFPATGVQLAVYGGSYVFVTITAVVQDLSYYVRYRAIVNNEPRIWTGLPPRVLIP